MNERTSLFAALPPVRPPESGETLVLATRDPDEAGARRLRRRLQELMPCLAGASEYSAGKANIWGVVTWAPSDLGELTARFGLPPRLAWLHQSGVGVEEIAALPIAGETVVTSIKGSAPYASPMAELAMARILEWTKDLPRFWRQQTARRWDKFDPPTLLGKTAIVFGGGAIGQAVAKRLAAFEVRILLARRRPEGAMTGCEVLDLDTARARLPEADYIVLAMPLTRETRHCLASAEIRRMKPDVFIVNLGRASLIDEAALAAALREGRVGGAALDVFWREPLAPDDEVWSWPRTAISPHMSANMRGGNADLIADTAVETLGKILAGELVGNRVNLAEGY